MSTMDRDAGGGTVERPTPADEQAEHPQLTFERVIQPGAAVPVVDLAVAADGTWIAASFADAEYDTIVLSPRGEVLTTLPGTPQAQLVASPSGGQLATFGPSSPLEVHVWMLAADRGEDPHAHPAICVLPYAARAASAVAWLPEADERTLYVGAAAGAVYRCDRTQEHSLPEQFPLRKLTASGVAVTALAASPQGSWLAIGSADGTLGIVALDGSTHELSYPGRHASGVGGLHVAHGWFLVSQAQGEPVCRVWNPANTSPWVREWRLTDEQRASGPGPKSRPNSAPGRYPFALDPQERWAYAAATLERIQPWRYWRWRPQDRLPELIPPGVADADRETRVTALAVGADGGLLAAGDERGRLWLWRVSTVG